jgi:hypothetical protein
VIEADRDRWYTARSLADLGQLTASFLEGHIGETPTHRGPPDPETAALVPVLAAANRAGFVTDCSQPGEPLTADGSAQCAFVSGYADPAVFLRLMTAAADTDLIITAARPGDEGTRNLATVTLDRGEEHTWAGGVESLIDLQEYYKHCHPEAAAPVLTAWHVNLIDPEYGRNDVLWPALWRFTASAK